MSIELLLALPVMLPLAGAAAALLARHHARLQLGLAIATLAAVAVVSAVLALFAIRYRVNQVIVGVVLMGLATIIVVPIAFNFLPDVALRRWLLSSLPWVAVFVIVQVVIGIMYRYGPNVKTPRTPVFTWGSLFAAMAWALASYGFAVYLNNFNSYNRIYGSIGAVIALLMWFYLGGFSVMLGALINLEMGRRRRVVAARALRAAAKAEQEKG